MQPIYKNSFVFLVTLLIILSNISYASADYNLNYDSNGNLIQDDKFSYEYDSFNQLIKIRDENNLLAEYFYDQNGERIKKAEYSGRSREPVSVTYYIGDFVRTVEGDKVTDSIYYYNNGQLVAKEENNKKYYYHPDYLGSTNLITDENGKMVSALSYLPFGESLSDNNERFTFTGQEQDEESNLMYYGARYYNPSSGRFIQPDEVIQDIYNPQNLNRYSYVLNNPYKYTDPTGNEPTQAQLGSPMDVISAIQFIEKSNPNLNPQQVLSLAVKNNFGGYESDKWAFYGSTINTRYIYTEERGFIDLQHFFDNARRSSYQSNIKWTYGDTILSSYILEAIQSSPFFGQQHSSFSYEDLPSNLEGAKFGKNLKSNKILSEQVKDYFDKIGAYDKQDINPEILGTLPQEQMMGIHLPSNKKNFFNFFKGLSKEQKVIRSKSNK